MRRVLFLPLALDESLQTVNEPLPLTVAARQIPRQLAELVAGQGNWRTSYMPLVGSDEGKRGFVGFGNLVPVEQLTQILQQQEMPELLVDGLLSEKQLELRISSPKSGEVLADSVLPFYPAALQALLNRLILELWDRLNIPGRPSTVPPVDPEVFNLFLIGRDEELAVAANLTSTKTESSFLPLLTALEKSPNETLVLNTTLALARHYIEKRRGDANEAVEALVKTIQLGARDLNFMKLASYLVRVTGNRGALRKVAVPYLELEPGDEELALSVGHGFFLQGEFEAATYVLSRCSAVCFDTTQASKPMGSVLALLSECYQKQQKVEDFEKSFAALRKCPTLTAHAADVLSKHLCENEQWQEALELLERTLNQGETDPGLYLEKARVHLLLLDPANAGVALDHLDTLESGHAEDSQRLRHFVDHPEILRSIEQAERALSAGDASEALKLTKNAIKNAPDFAEPHYLLGLVRSSMQQPKKAIKSLEKAINIRPDFAEARNRLGILLVSLGKYGQAYDHLALVLAQRPDLIGPLLHMAQACHYLNRQEEGESHLARAEELDPGNTLVSETRSMFFS